MIVSTRRVRPDSAAAARITAATMPTTPRSPRGFKEETARAENSMEN